jgi:zinc protease
LTVDYGYDHLQITASGRADKLVTILETVSNAITNPTIDKETTARLKAAQIARVDELAKDPAYLADRVATQRLLGTFPYGRPVEGSHDSIVRIDFADLIDVKQRFLTADNATVAISGKFDPTFAYRAVRRYFGSWLKADKLVPSTFRQPDDPPGTPLMIDSPVADRFEVRMITRGASRSGTDADAFSILARIAEVRLRSLAPAGHSGDVRVVSAEHFLPGTFTFAISGRKDPAAPKVEAADLFAKVVTSPITDNELQAAKAAHIAAIDKRDIADRWLDMDTYRTEAPAKLREKAAAVTLADIQRTLEKVRKQPFAIVVVSSAPSAN